MSWHMAAMTLDNLGDLPKRCRSCVFWELSQQAGEQAVRFGSPELEKEAWVSEVLLEWGSCGRVVYMRGAPAGYVMYAPPSAVPRAAEMPTGPVSADAVLLTTMQVMPEFSGEGIGRMLAQAVAKDLTRRGVKAVEVFGDARPGHRAQLHGPGRLPAQRRVQDRAPAPAVAAAADGAAVGHDVEGRRRGSARAAPGLDHRPAAVHGSRGRGPPSGTDPGSDGPQRRSQGAPRRPLPGDQEWVGVIL